MRWRSAVGSSLVLAVAILRGVASCDSSTEVTPASTPEASDRSDRPAIPSDGAGDSTAIESDAGDWVHVPDVPADCHIETPASAASMPPPIEWEPCGAPVPALAGCRQMKVSWSPPTVPGLGSVVDLIRGARAAGGAPLLMLGRISGNYIYRLIAAPDGSVLSAFREDVQPDGVRCILFPYNTDSDRFAYLLFEDEADGGTRAHSAVLGELANPRLRVAFRVVTDSPYHAGFSVGAEGLVRLFGKMNLHDWNNLDASTFLGPTDEGPPGFLFPQGDALFWSSGYLSVMKHKVWTRDAGSRDFLGFGSDTTRGAADLGTDGKDMVWVEGSGRPSPSALFSDVVAKTAPYATDGSQIVPRTLRSDLGPYGFADSPFTVGCGYAVREASPPAMTDGGIPLGAGIDVIRLSDGYAARLSNAAGRTGWKWGSPLIATCDEVFVSGSSAGKFNVVRVPWSALSWQPP